MKTWFISGASSGIGAELARQVAARGDGVALAARRIGRLQVLADELASSPARVTIHEMDVVDAASVDAAMRAADAAHGGIDVLVANAGTGGGAVLGSGDHAANAHVMATNVVGVMAQVDVGLSLMQRRGTGQVVLVSSVAASRGLPGTVASYSASKAAVTSLGQSLQAQLVGSGITVTTLCPGYVATEMTEGVPTPFKVAAPAAVARMVEAIDQRRDVAWIPGWWRPLAGVLRHLPRRVVRHLG